MATGEADSAIAHKFLMNPTQVETMDDLYDLLELGKDSPLKYFFVQRVDQGYLGLAHRALIPGQRMSE
jgi:hypothetical protein